MEQRAGLREHLLTPRPIRCDAPTNVTTPVNDCIIAISGVSKTYDTVKGEGVVALTDIDLAILSCEFLVGPSGCGKSTLLKIVGGLSASSAGTVAIGGEVVTQPRRDIGFVFQDAVLLPWRTVLDNVMLPVEVQKLDRHRYRDRALDLLQMVGLEGFVNKYPHELSGGMQQRAAIARSLVTDPAILLMDEPFGALDVLTREQLNLDLLRIWREASKTIVFVTHSISESVFLADRVVVLSARPGRIVQVEPIELRRPRDLDVMVHPEFGRAVTEIRPRLELKGRLE